MTRYAEITAIAAVLDGEIHIDPAHGYPVGYGSLQLAKALYDAGLRCPAPETVWMSNATIDAISKAWPDKVRPSVEWQLPEGWHRG